MTTQLQTSPLRVLGAFVFMLSLLLTGCSTSTEQTSAQSKLAHEWPPTYGRPYPDLKLPDQSGKDVRLSSFKGKILIVEPIGMSCPACQAFNGANSAGIGPFRNCQPQRDLSSIEQYLGQHGISLNDPRIVFVELLLYSPSMKAPTMQEAQAWARHFRLGGANRVVLVGNDSLINQASYDMIPGFQLLDRSFVLTSDCTGHNPKPDLTRHLIPRLQNLLSN